MVHFTTVAADGEEDIWPRFCMVDGSAPGKGATTRELGAAARIGEVGAMDASVERKLDPTQRSVESRDFEAGLRRKIVGQDEAVQAVVDLYQVFRAG
ncbi:MAG: hypothetical protein WB985_13145, partial [Candidatus Acidiferrales bacterium]